MPTINQLIRHPRRSRKRNPNLQFCNMDGIRLKIEPWLCRRRLNAESVLKLQP